MSTPTPLDQQRQLVHNFLAANKQRADRENACQKQFAASEAATQQQHSATEKAAQQQHISALQQTANQRSQSGEKLKDAADSIEKARASAAMHLVAMDVADRLPSLEATTAAASSSATTAAPLPEFQAAAERIGDLTRSAAQMFEQWQQQRKRQRVTLIAAAVAAVVLAVAGYFLYQKRSYEQEIAANAAALIAEIDRVTREDLNQMTNPVDGTVYVHVPAGEFLMGSPDGQGDDDEHPQHTVTLDAFWIMQTEVTNSQYAQCVATGACRAPSNDSWQDADRADHPVTYVTRQQASDYAAWSGGRLPTEAEWEKAACGTDGRTYPWGDAAPAADLLNFNQNVGDTTPVGSYPVGASPYGALDMAGNVYEWTADWYASDSYSQSPASNPTGPTSGQYHVLRGGSFYSDGRWVRCAARYGPVSIGFDYGGFRVVSPGF